MTVGGSGLPRLQDLAYLETIAKAVRAGLPFESIRLALVDHIWMSRQAAPGEPLDPANYKAARADEKRYVRNVTDALKELMRLGFVKTAILPSSGNSAYAHRDARYEMTQAGAEWAAALLSDRRAAYEGLIPKLIHAHPVFSDFLAAVGAMEGSRSSLVIPLLRWGELPANRRSQELYRAEIGGYVASALASADLGWRASAFEIGQAVNDYLDRILARAQARQKDPFPNIRAFTQTCEEALARLAFKKAGCAVDYVSMEIARRWSRWLGLASFTYYAPGPHALRYWSAAEIRFRDGGCEIRRRAGDEWRDRALEALHEHCHSARAAGTTYVPIWEARAAVCWQLKIVDDEFDRAVTEMIAGTRGQQLDWRVHLDQVSVGSTPTSASPLTIITAAAGSRTFNVITVVPKLPR